jgi:hypothetical protein
MLHLKYLEIYLISILILLLKKAFKRILNLLMRFPNKVQGNATSYMMERSLARIKSLEVATSRNRDLRDLDLSDAEWALVKEAIGFLNRLLTHKST